MDSQQIEIVGRAALETALVRNGFEVARPNRDKGIDLIVYEPIPTFRALPIQAKARTNRAFSVDKKYQLIPGLVLAYIWDVGETQQRIFLMTYREAVELLGSAVETRSWVEHGLYRFPRPSAVLSASLEAYEDRWDWLRAQLGEATIRSRQN